MIIEGISVRYRRKFDLGQYNSLELDEMIHVKLEEGESFEDVERKVWALAKSSVQAQALPVVRPRQEALQSAFDSLPDAVKEAILANRI